MPPHFIKKTEWKSEKAAANSLGVRGLLFAQQPGFAQREKFNIELFGMVYFMAWKVPGKPPVPAGSKGRQGDDGGAVL